MSAADTKYVTSPINPDPKSVRAFIAEMVSKGAIAALIAAIVKLIVCLHAINAELNGKLAAKSRKRPPNESMRRLQLELTFMPKPANDTGAPSDQARPDPKKGERGKKGAKTMTPHGRPKLPDHLERVPELHLVDAAHQLCPWCGAKAHHVSFTCTEKLELVPAHWVVLVIKRETVASGCDHAYIFTAPKGDEVLDRGILGTTALVESMVDHYDDAVPWERMERRAREQDVPLAANTLAASVFRVIDLFDPIVKHITHECLTSPFTALDATRMPVIDPKHPLGIRSGSLWLIEGAHKYAMFGYAPSGHAEHLEKLIEGYTLASVMCDGSPTNNCVERGGARRGGCNAHARRGLVEALRGGDMRALEGLTIFASIFHVDAESKKHNESIDERFARRERESTPLVEKLRGWRDARIADVEPKSVLGKAVRYIFRQWKRITAFMSDPLMDLTNNEVERDLRRWVLDRRTWFFCGHDDSARCAADALTLITTCKKHGIDPRRYLRDTLARILAGEKKLSALLPETYAAAIAAAEAPVSAVA